MGSLIRASVQRCPINKDHESQHTQNHREDRKSPLNESTPMWGDPAAGHRWLRPRLLCHYDWRDSNRSRFWWRTEATNVQNFDPKTPLQRAVTGLRPTLLWNRWAATICQTLSRVTTWSNPGPAHTYQVSLGSCSTTGQQARQRAREVRERQRERECQKEKKGRKKIVTVQ